MPPTSVGASVFDNALNGHAHGATSITSLSAQSGVVAVGGQDGRVRMLSGKPLYLREILPALDTGIAAVSLSRDGHFALYGSFNGEVCLADVRRGTVQFQWRAHTQSIVALDMSENGNWIVTAGSDKTIKVWQMRDRADPSNDAERYVEALSVGVPSTPRAMQLRDDLTLVVLLNQESTVRLLDIARISVELRAAGLW